MCVKYVCALCTEGESEGKGTNGTRGGYFERFAVTLYSLFSSWIFLFLGFFLQFRSSSSSSHSRKSGYWGIEV